MFNRLRELIEQQDRQCVFDLRVGRIRVFAAWNIFRRSDCLIYCGKSFVAVRHSIACDYCCYGMLLSLYFCEQLLFDVACVKFVGVHNLKCRRT
jgi:hypothetical protein